MNHHDVPEADVAAALAVVAQGETPLLLDPADERPVRVDRDRGDRPERDARDGGDRPERRARPSQSSLVKYRLAVGRRHRVEPRQIVGALANEGGLRREDFGQIDIRPEFTLVELPADMPGSVLDKLSGTRIGGKLIEMRLDQGAPGGRRDRERKPRH